MDDPVVHMMHCTFIPYYTVVQTLLIPVAQFWGGGLHFNESVHLVLNHPAPPLPAPRGHMGPGVTPGGSRPGWK